MQKSYQTRATYNDLLSLNSPNNSLLSQKLCMPERSDRSGDEIPLLFRIHACLRAKLVPNSCKTRAKRIQNSCKMHGKLVQNPCCSCKTRVKLVPNSFARANSCKIHAKLVQNVCQTRAKLVQNPCQTHAKLVPLTTTSCR